MTLRVAVAGVPARASRVLHVAVRDPAGREILAYSGTLRAPGGHGLWRVALARNDAPGRWRIVVSDRLSGRVAAAEVTVSTP